VTQSTEQAMVLFNGKRTNEDLKLVFLDYYH